MVYKKHLALFALSSFLLTFCFVIQSRADSDGFGGRFGLAWGPGKIQDARDTIPRRNTYTTEASLLAGYRLGAWMPGLNFNYRITAQRTRPAEVQNQNVKGKGYLLGLAT